MDNTHGIRVENLFNLERYINQYGHWVTCIGEPTIKHVSWGSQVTVWYQADHANGQNYEKYPLGTIITVNNR